MREADVISRIEPLDRADCVRLLATQQVGRLAFIRNGQPDVLPVNYALDGDAVVFATASGPKLWAAGSGAVAFEVDRINSATRSAWSVVVHGFCHEITVSDTPALLERVARLPLEPWAGGDKPHIIRLTPQDISGRRVGPRSEV